MNKRKLWTSGISGLFLLSMINGVLAADYSGKGSNLAGTVVSFLGGIFGTLLQSLNGKTEILSRVLFAVLLGMIIYTVIDSIFKKSNDWIKWGITGAVTLIALLGLPSGFLEVLRVQYGAMGATILTVIPFMIILFFSLKTDKLVVARVTWLFYAGYYFAMYTYKIANAGGWGSGEKAIPYMAAWVVGGFLFFGIGAIRGMLFKGKIDDLRETAEHKIKENYNYKRLALKSDKATVNAATGEGDGTWDGAA